jgi:hypothetical protein
MRLYRNSSEIACKSSKTRRSHSALVSKLPKLYCNRPKIDRK